MAPAGASGCSVQPAAFEPYRAGALVSLLRLHWFIRLRWFMMLVASAVLLIERFVFEIVGRPAGLFCVVAVIGVVNLGWTLTSRLLRKRLHDSRASEVEAVRSARVFANSQVAVDLLLLTLILRYTGGVENPMAIFYLFHMAIGSLLLSGTQAVLQGAWAIALYAVLGIGELTGWIQPHHPFLPRLPDTGHYAQPAVVGCAVLVLACGVVGTLHFTLQIAGRLDEQQRRLRTTLAVLQQSQVAIRDLQARRSRFMQTAAHQLKSPLAAIQTLAGLIRDGVVDGSAVRETCERIRRRCHDGIVSVTELLTLARVQDADPQHHEDVVVDVGAVTGQVCRRRAQQAADKHVAMTCDVPAEVDLRAHVRQADLTDCVDNLVDNAIKYTPAQGSVAVTVRRADPAEGSNHNGTVTVKASAAGDLIAVAVSDTGMGIEAEQLAGADGSCGEGSVFDAFRRGNGALAAGIPGSGLGLAIVRAVVEQAGGRLQVRSKPGEGSTFTVMFPADQSLSGGPRVRDTRASEIIIDNPEVCTATPHGAVGGSQNVG